MPILHSPYARVEAPREMAAGASIPVDTPNAPGGLWYASRRPEAGVVVSSPQTDSLRLRPSHLYVFSANIPEILARPPLAAQSHPRCIPAKDRNLSHPHRTMHWSIQEIELDG